MSHTPGPWRVGDICGGCINIEADTTPRHITVGRIHMFSLTSEAEDNARLIAAAPELLKTCQMLLKSLRGLSPDHRINDLHNEVDWLRAAIAKAEGRDFAAEG